MSVQFPITGSQLISDITFVAVKAIVFFVIILAGIVIGKLLGNLVGRVIARAGGDSLLKQTVVGRALMRSDYASFKLANAITKWFVYIGAILYAFYSLGLPILTSTVTSFILYLPILIGSAIILIVGMIISDWLGEFVKKSSSPEKRDLLGLNIVGDLVKIVLYFVTLTLALNHLGVDVTILYIFAEAFAWAIAIAVGIASGLIVGWVLKDRVKEWISTIIGH
jgi:hypothetical protein